MRQMTVDLNISADEYLALYRGVVCDVIAKSRDGRTVRFPANSLQKYVTRMGVSGTFDIYFDHHNKLLDVVKR